MSVNFRLLLDFRRRLDGLNDEGIGKLAKNFFENQAQGSKSRNEFVGEIFNSLYNQSKYCGKDSISFFHQLINECDNLRIKYGLNGEYTSANNHDQYNSNPFDNPKLSDSLITHIASYLPTRNLFTQWNHVNRKFCQIGMKPQSIIHLNLVLKRVVTKNKDQNEAQIKLPHFKIGSLFSKVESLYCRCNSSDQSLLFWTNLFDSQSISFKSLKSLNINNGALKLLLKLGNLSERLLNNVDNLEMVCLYDIISANDTMETKQFVFNLLQKICQLKINPHGKKVELFLQSERLLECFQSVDSISNNHDTLSKSERKRILTSFLNQLIPKPSNDKIENENEIDETELTYPKLASSRLKMLLFFGRIEQWNPEIEWDELDEWNQWFDIVLPSSRIQQSLSNVKCIAIDESIPLFYTLTPLSFIITKILNTIGNQLESLQIGEQTAQISQWKFCQTKDITSCGKKFLNEKWFPTNVKHLCFRELRIAEMRLGQDFLWHDINSQTFPNLKHLVITCDNCWSNIGHLFPMDDKNEDNYNLRKDGAGFFASLIENGLQSLIFKIKDGDVFFDCPCIFFSKEMSYGENIDSYVSMSGIMLLFDQIFFKVEEQVSNANDNNCNNKTKNDKKSEQFIFKLKFDEYLSLDMDNIENYCEKWSKSNFIQFIITADQLYGLLCHLFDKVMLTVSIDLNVTGCIDSNARSIMVQSLKQAFQNVQVKYEMQQYMDFKVYQSQFPDFKMIFIFKNCMSICDNDPQYVFPCQFAKFH